MTTGLSPSRRRVAGFMSGTSLDGLDAALVEVQGTGFEARFTFVRGVSVPLGEVEAPLRALVQGSALSARQIADCALALARVHIDAARALLQGDSCDLLSIHGQTVHHAPPSSWQLLQPAPIVQALGVPVIYDLRQADLAAGGQGAPLTPLADAMLFGDLDDTVAIVNLGGFCNVTLLPGGVSRRDRVSLVRAKDICACNQVLDEVARRALHAPCDRDGAAASSGRVDPASFASLVAMLHAQASAGRSLGSGDEASTWVAKVLGMVTPQDLARTACEAIARVVVEVIRADEPRVSRLILAGGSVRNRALVQAISAAASGLAVQHADALGIPAAYREAVCWAVLGSLAWDGVPVSLPQVTLGAAPAPLAGAIMPAKATYLRA